MSRALALIKDTDVISELRALQPARQMTWPEAHAIAERQAGLLLDLLHIAEPPVPLFVISSLPGIVVDWQRGWPREASSFDAGSHWQIVVRASDCRQRKRFSLAHEFKHVLDDPVISQLFPHLSPEARAERAERLCNYFAACLLMPRPWVKRDYYGGLQKVSALARRYYVSTEAMTTRLSELGLAPITLGAELGPGRHREAA